MYFVFLCFYKNEVNIANKKNNKKKQCTTGQGTEMAQDRFTIIFSFQKYGRK